MMKIYVLLCALASLVAAQSGLPACTQDCVTKFTSGANIGGCPQIDAKCICSQQSFLSDIACCLASVCDAADQQAAVNFAVDFCSTQGVTVPSAVTCSSITSTGTASSTESVTSGAANSTAAITTTSTTGTGTGTAASGSPSPTSTASHNVGHQGGGGSGATGIFGGLFAVLALI